MELEPENSYLDRMELFFNKALEVYKGFEETEQNGTEDGMSERWKPEKGETFWWFDFDGRIYYRTYHDDSFDFKFVEFGNIFKTKEEAEVAAEKIRKFLVNGYDLNADFEITHKVLEYLGDKLKKSVENIPPTMPYDQYKLTQTINFLKNKKSELAVFPEWCKVGTWVYSPCGCDSTKGTYFKITQIDGVCIIGEENVCHVDNAVRARLRPYNSEEMKALVEKVLSQKSYDFRGLIHFASASGKNIEVSNFTYSSEELIGSDYTIDGKPCGVLEHLNENGEWVE